MSPLLDVAAATHPGRVRSHNEDWISADGDTGFAVLADGMGGHKAGEVASRMAVDLVSAGLRSSLAPGECLHCARAENLIATHVAAANAGIFEAARSELQYDGMGTTLVVVLWHEDGVTWGHVGDSRLYLLRDGTLTQLTRDHSIVQEQLERGAISREQARHALNRNVLTRAVGIDPDVDADVHSFAVQAGDVYLLCSDGLTDMVIDEHIQRTLLSCGAHVETAAQRLIEQANEHGGLDNISVILVRVVSVPRERPA